jgi:hypothetical protein
MSNCNSFQNCNKSKNKSYHGPILSFNTSKSNKSKITALFKDNNENKVKEYVNIYQHAGDAKECLILLYKQVMDLGDLNNYWGSSMKELGQLALHALSREHQTMWNKIMAFKQTFTSNLSNRDTFLTCARNFYKNSWSECIQGSGDGHG